MLHLILIRPGSTDYDQEERIQGNLDIPLNEQGGVEVARMIDELADHAVDAVYAPPCQPSKQTGEAIARARGLKCRKLDRMQNLDHGLWQGMKIDEVRHKQARVYRQWQEQPECIRPPEGEMLEQARQRVEAAMAKLLKRHKEGTIAVVLPEPMATLVRRYFDHGELGDLWKATTMHGHWELIEVDLSVSAASS